MFLELRSLPTLSTPLFVIQVSIILLLLPDCYGKLIYCSVANGDVSPFVGHNAILRWSALQQVVYEDEDGYEKFWSESHVSEDFDMSLRLQVAGYTVRLGSYTGDGFKEGV